MPAFQKNKTTKPSDSPQTPETVLTTTFLKIRRRLQIISASILGNDTEAEDALSEAFLRLWKHPQSVNSFQRNIGFQGRKIIVRALFDSSSSLEEESAEEEIC